MKDIDIHNGLDKQTLRDYFSHQTVDIRVAGFDNKKEVNNLLSNEDTWEWAKNDARNQIKYLQRYIQNIERQQAVELLITQEGWIEWDVSDYVENSYSSRYRMSFIGTEKEHDKFLMNFGD